MKHLFFVHSHITYLVVDQYVKDNHICPEDCLFVLMERYRSLPPESNYSNVISLQNGLLPENCTRVFQNWNVFRGFRNIRHMNRELNRFFCGDSFSLYLPNTNSDIHSALVTMNQCAGFYVIEEGAASYLRSEELPELSGRFAHFIIKMLSGAVPWFYALKKSFCDVDNKYFLGTIATSARAFPGFPGPRILISSPFSKIELDVVPDIILSVDASLAIALGNVFPEKLFERLRSFFINNNYKKVAYKFHPIFYQDASLQQLYRQGINSVFGNSIFELNENCKLENVLYSYPIDFCSDFSSVGIYAANFGRKCYSIMDMVQYDYADSPHKAMFLQHIPKIIYDSYTMISVP